ncbi:transposase [Maledivibacter halophilus]|uniref:REP element-mobilizing transposase RayT n=1 Tax=Maledivibacter halophilus TaxID=36842 RepID=A0A1T5MKN9_9FIRM|nr:transposase [Maledivibacter halophilus]SKC88488.1 REP element-mobilizing transposase RayT [Maledivibacter halophilus]
MARKQRIHYEGALYHVICRGNNREYIFDKEEDKKIYLETILRYKEKYKFKLYAYCIMDNHGHLLIEVGKVPLSKIMQGIQQVFTMKYNKKNGRTGHVFEQRYKAILCNKDEYLLSLIRYIHQNPMRAGIKEKLDYQWSSHRTYIEKNASRLVDYKYILSILSEDINKAIKKYAELIEEEIDKEEMTEEELNKGIRQDRQPKQHETKKLDHKYIKQKTCEYYGVEPNELSKKTRKQKIVNARKALILISKEFSDISNKELAKELHLAESTVSNILSDENNKKLTQIIKL